ncbi:hypothetical protein BGY98DRAFT_1173261 [Russula aff. rugulosa BPL654]|nr:hypothetical protein BGY98DRAFT_1173261 [Russula aff. rugulosa BPL654]
MTAVPAPVIVPSTPTHRPVGALLCLGDPAMLLSPVMFSANGNLLFSPEVDDDDDGNTLKLTKAARVLSPIRVWQCAERSRMERPASRLQCKSSEVGTCEPTVAGTGTSTREYSLPAGSDDEETCLEGGSSREKGHRNTLRCWTYKKFARASQINELQCMIQLVDSELRFCRHASVPSLLFGFEPCVAQKDRASEPRKQEKRRKKGRKTQETPLLSIVLVKAKFLYCAPSHESYRLLGTSLHRPSQQAVSTIPATVGSHVPTSLLLHCNLDAGLSIRDRSAHCHTVMGESTCADLVSFKVFPSSSSSTSGENSGLPFAENITGLNSMAGSPRRNKAPTGLRVGVDGTMTGAGTAVMGDEVET